MYIAFDIETTGLSAEKDQIIEVAAIKFEGEEIIDCYQTLINPKVALPAIITRLTGLTDNDLETAPDFAEIKDDLRNFIGDLPIVGHFISFDINFLKAKGLILDNVLLDTCELAQVLLPKEPSYSLEILSSKFNLPHVNKHRARGDDEAAIHLLNFLRQKIAEIPPQIGEAINRYLLKSGWEWKGEFEEKRAGGQAGKQASKQVEKRAGRQVEDKRNLGLREKIEQVLKNQKSYLIEAELYAEQDYVEPCLEYLKKHEEKMVIVNNSQDFYVKFNEMAEKLLMKNKVAYLAAADQYFCRRRFTEFLNKERFLDYETTFLLKIFLWLNQTEMGLKSELTVRKDEHLCWGEVCGQEDYCFSCEEDDCFYRKAKKSAEKARLVSMNQFSLIKEYADLALKNQDKIDTSTALKSCPLGGTKRCRSVSTLSTQESRRVDLLLIDQADELEEKMGKALESRFSLRRFDLMVNRLRGVDDENKEKLRILKSRLEIFFGLMGILLEKFFDQDRFSLNVDLSAESSLEWKKILDSAENLRLIAQEIERDSSEAKPALREFLKNLEKMNFLLKNHQNTLLTVTQTQDEEIFLNAFPVDLGRIFIKAILENTKAVVLLSPTLTTRKNFNFIRRQLDLPDDFEEKIINYDGEKKILCFLAKNILPPKSDESFQELREILAKIIAEKEGQIYVLTSSVEASHTLQTHLIPFFKDKKYHILAQKSGGAGKIMEQYKHHPENSIIIGNYTFLKLMIQDVGDFPLPVFRTLIVTRLAFDSPADYLVSLRQQKYQGGFMDFALPRTIVKLKKAIDQFVGQKGEEIFCLDSRVFDSSYGEEIVKSLPNYIGIQFLDSNI